MCQFVTYCAHGSLEAAAVRVTWWASEHVSGAAHSHYDADGTGTCHI